MLTWIIAAGASAALIAVPPSVTQYDAVIAPDAAAPESFIGSAGVVHISLSDDALRYDVTIAGVRHITNIALVDSGRAVELYGAGDSRGNELHVQGEIPASQIDDIPASQLSMDLSKGVAEVVVFTTNEPGGVMEGTLKPAGLAAPTEPSTARLIS